MRAGNIGTQLAIRLGVGIQDRHEGGLPRLTLSGAELLIKWNALAPPQPELEFARIGC